MAINQFWRSSDEDPDREPQVKTETMNVRAAFFTVIPV
jgi:hypothetical protein